MLNALAMAMAMWPRSVQILMVFSLFFGVFITKNSPRPVQVLLVFKVFLVFSLKRFYVPPNTWFFLVFLVFRLKN